VHGIGPQEVALGSQKTRMTRISQQQLESYLWGAATLLRGTIDAGDYKQFIFPLLFYKRICDVFDEETSIALKESGGDKSFAAYRENHRFQVPPEAHWFEVRQTSNNVGQALQSAMRAIEIANPEKLYGIFGDAQWTNKDRLSDAMLRDLVEHFSSLDLTLANLPEDELGQGYEYLIKKFADDAGHTAAEFYTNRTVVHLMTEMLEPQPGESIYDPTCGSGGMLLSCITHLRRQGKEWRNVRLYGQERNLMTSSIARMNCFLHGIEDFQIVRGDTLSEPKFLEGDRLMRFDVVLANPPYSIKQWDRDAFASDPWGRNLFGTPPQSRADYAFWQHILCSLAPKTGRCAILFPHGILFRDAEEAMRRKIIETDLIECVVGLGPNLFYNSSMPSCIVICRANKPKSRRQNILFINADNEVTRDRAQSFLTNDHIERIVNSYRKFRDERGFARVVRLEEVRAKNGDLNLPLYIPSASISPTVTAINGESVARALKAWMESLTAEDGALSVLISGRAAAKRRAIFRIPSAMPLIQDRRDWPKVRLGDIVVKTEETQRKPLDAGFDRYLLVEHLDANSLRIRRWGQIEDGSLPPTFYKVFRKGQVLYPTRNPHLRRVAVADFDGICGEKTLTLTSCEQVDAHFLPFIFQSEAFITHATNRRIGSTNPHVRWRDIADFQLLLPPLDQQRRIAEILWVADEGFQGWLETVHAVAKYHQSIVTDFIASHESDIATLGDCLEEVQYGTSNKATLLPAPGLWPLLRIPNVIGGKVDFADLQWLGPTEEFEKYRLRSGDVLIVRTNGNPDYVGRTAVYEGSQFGECLFASYLIRLRSKREKLLPRFLHEILQSARIKKDIRKQVKSSAGNYNLNTQGIRGLRIPVPATEAQQELLECLASIYSAVESATQHAETTRTLQSAFVNSLFNVSTL
jgi:type I restriction enzyme M protein